MMQVLSGHPLADPSGQALSEYICVCVCLHIYLSLLIISQPAWRSACAGELRCASAPLSTPPPPAPPAPPPPPPPRRARARRRPRLGPPVPAPGRLGPARSGRPCEEPAFAFGSDSLAGESCILDGGLMAGDTDTLRERG